MRWRTRYGVKVDRGIYSLLKVGLVEEMKLVVTLFQWIHYNQDGIGVGLQVPQQTEEPKLLEILCNHRDTQLVMIQEITTE
jgi:hypothetical protein